LRIFLISEEVGLPAASNATVAGMNDSAGISLGIDSGRTPVTIAPSRRGVAKD
jgi:hypothetical protein